MAAALWSDALADDDLALIAKIDIVNAYVKKKEQPPEDLPIVNHLMLIDSIGNKLVAKGNDHVEVAGLVTQFLDEYDIDVCNDTSGMKSWFDILELWIITPGL